MKHKRAAKRGEAAYVCHFRPEPEGGYTVTCPSLPPVVSYGETLEEARERVREAIELCLEVMEQKGQPIPPPDSDPRRAVDELVSVAITGG